MSDKKIKLSALNEHISCHICKGYFIEATTVIECLHTFCKTCIVKHLKDHNNCPKCNQLIHQSHPLNYIAFDRTMQDIVYKIVPGLEKPVEPNANGNCNSFEQQTATNDSNNNNTKHKTTYDSSSSQNNLNKPKKTEENHNFHRDDEQINLVMLPSKCWEYPYLRVSCLATVTHLKKYLALKRYGDIEQYRQLDLFCNDSLLGNDHNLKFVSLTQWRNRAPPIEIRLEQRENDW